MGALPGIPEESGSGESNTEESSAARLTPAPPPEPLPAGPPEEYIDPISQEVMLDPVLLVETGQSYERATIEAWFTRCKEEGWPCTDPLTRQELRSCTVVPNFSLRSLISGWAERQRISDLPSFSKQVGRQRSQAHASGAAAAAAAALAGLRLGGSSTGVAATDDSSSSVRYPAVQPAHHQPDGPAYAAAALQQPQQGAAAPSGRPQAPPAAAQPQQHRPQDVHFEQPPAGSAVRPGLYPRDQQPMLPDKREQADTALGALRSAATQQGGTRGAAGYSAWTLQQLAGDAEGRDLLWEGNAIPLAIFLLGQLSKAPEDAALAAAAPALCAMLQRLGARDAGVASSISQCGGLHALVGHLTAPQPELRAAACRALYFLGWMGDDLRSQTLAEMEHLATLCKLPPKPLLALWRFWEQPAQQQGSQSSADAGGASTSSDALLPAGRAQEWESLALLLHMLAEGCSREARSSTDSAAAAAELHRLDVSSSAVPAALAHAAALSGDTAVRFAAQEAVSLLSQLPQNRRLLLTAALQQGQQAGQPAGAGRMCWLLWALCSHPSGGSRPAAVQAVAQQGRALLATLQAAFDPGQPAEAASRWLAAGLLTCLLHEPAVRGDSSAAAAADAVRRLLASTAAAPVLQNLLASLQPAAAAAAPQAARAAALAVANLSDFRGAAMSTALPAQALARTQGSQGSGDFKEWLSARLAGSSKRGSNLQPAVQGQNGSVGPGAAAAAAAMAAVEQQQDPQQQQQQQQPEQQATQAAAPLMQQPTDPRGALLFHGAMQALAALVASSSAAAAASDAAARGNGAAGAPGTAAALTPDNQQQVASAAAEAAEAAAQHRAVLCAALLALNNLCADPTAAAALRSISKAAPGLMQQLQAALTAALGDRALPEACRGHARLLLQTLSGVPGQRHQPACTALAAPQPAAAYPNP